MKVTYIAIFKTHYPKNNIIKHLPLSLFDLVNDDDGYKIGTCDTIESISKMTGWPSAYQLAVF